MHVSSKTRRYRCLKPRIKYAVAKVEGEETIQVAGRQGFARVYVTYLLTISTTPTSLYAPHPSITPQQLRGLRQIPLSHPTTPIDPPMKYPCYSLIPLLTPQAPALDRPFDAVCSDCTARCQCLVDVGVVRGRCYGCLCYSGCWK